MTTKERELLMERIQVDPSICQGKAPVMVSVIPSSSTLRGEVRKGQLYLASEGTNGQFVPAHFESYKNSSGYPILKANGVEYSQCK